MRIYSLKSSKYGISCSQIYYIISAMYNVYRENGQRHKDLKSLFKFNFGRFNDNECGNSAKASPLI